MKNSKKNNNKVQTKNHNKNKIKTKTQNPFNIYKKQFKNYKNNNKQSQVIYKE